MDSGSRKKDGFIHVSFTATDGTKNPALLGVSTGRTGLMHPLMNRRPDMFRALREQGFQPVEFLESYADTYQPGNDRHISAVLEGLVDIDESALTWRQVSEFRSDADLQYRAADGPPDAHEWIGYPNRIFIVSYCIWLIVAAWGSRKSRNPAP